MKNLDGCSCKTCANTYKADGAGGCSKVTLLRGTRAWRICKVQQGHRTLVPAVIPVSIQTP